MSQPKQGRRQIVEKFGSGPKPRDWAYAFTVALETLSRRANVDKGRIAQALGFSRHLSVSTITGSDGWYDRLSGAFNALRIPYVAARLGLARNDYPLVEEFFADAVQALLGYEVDMKQTRAGLRESVDWGVAGVELVDQGSLLEAREYLEWSWQAWLTAATQPSWPFEEAVRRGDLPVMLKTGTYLLVLDGLNGRLVDSGPITELRGMVLRCRRAASHDRQMLTAAGAAFAQIGVGYRLLGSNDLRLVVGYSRQAVDVLTETGTDLKGQLCGLRDQAKPLVKAMLWETQPLRATGLMTDAEAAFRRADQLAGEDSPPEELRLAWLLTRATWAECLSIAGRVDEARHLWDSVQAAPWLGPLLKESVQLPIRTKMLMTEMALVAGQGNLDELGRLAQAFQQDSANSGYGERLARARELERYAVMGDQALFQRAVLR